MKILAAIATAVLLAPLAGAATVTAEIHQVAPHQVIAVELLAVREGGRAPDKVVQTVRLTESDELDRTVRFENVAAGRYVVTVHGKEAWQRAGEPVDVFDFETAPVHVQVSPFAMRLRVAAEGQAVANARVVLRHHEAFWEVPVETDGNGDAAIELWQIGPLSATVKVDGHVPFRVRRTFKEAVDTDWLLEMPKREVTGTVIDAQTGAPVSKASLALEMQSRSDQLTVSVNAADDGTFRFAPVFPGEHTLQAAARDYPVAKITYTFGEEEEAHHVTIALERQPKTTLAVVDARGRPVLDADVHVFHAGHAVVHTRTSRDGTAAVFVPQNEEREVWIIPANGSLAVARIASGTPQTRIAVADGSCRIVVRTETESEKPIAGIMADVRWNGLTIPDVVMERLVGRGSRIVSQQDGRLFLQQMPPGTYELAVAGAKPLRIVAVPGETSAVMTFTSTP